MILSIITIICGALTVAYALLMVAYRMGWARQQEFELPPNYAPHTSITVIIPARNESGNIGACVQAILAQQYPAHLLEVIVVDDHSEDGTAEVIAAFNAPDVRCIKLADHLQEGQIIAYKKAAIALGVAQSTGELMVTTDADCVAEPQWLVNVAAIYEQQKAVMVVAPVIYSCHKSVLQIFQLIDFMSMQGITAAAYNLRMGNMSNGANLAFGKAAFERVGGYAGVDHLASGDDYLLMMKLHSDAPGSIAYLKSQDAIVTTAPQMSWRGFLQQRIRWSSKSGKYGDVKLTAILVLVYLFNFSFLFALIAGCLHPALLWALAAMLMVKVVVEYLFLVPVADFFKQKWVLPYFFMLQPLHIGYVIVAGFLGFFGTYQWKGRRVR